MLKPEVLLRVTATNIQKEIVDGSNPTVNGAILSTKQICKIFYSRIIVPPTAQTKFNLDFGVMKDEWTNIYSLPYFCSTEVSMRIFSI